MKTALIFLTLLFPTPLFAKSKISLQYGYVYKFFCKGTLYVSAVGDERIVQRQALPKELGCGVLLKAKTKSGSTNLLLETSTGTINQLLNIVPPQKEISPSTLEIHLGGNR